MSQYRFFRTLTFLHPYCVAKATSLSYAPLTNDGHRDRDANRVIEIPVDVACSVMT